MLFEMINTDKYDPWPLYVALQEHFPVGMMRRDEAENLVYRSYPGLKKYSDALTEHIHDESSYENVWGAFERRIKEHFKKEVIGTTYGQAPSFSCSVRLLKDEYPGFQRFFDLGVFVSVIALITQSLGKTGASLS
jgi:hypothetical protein